MTTTIFKSTTYQTYTVLSNEFIANQLPGNSFKILTYLLSRPNNWMKNNAHLAKTLNLSLYSVKKGLRQLLEYGYAQYIRFKDGSTRWSFYDTQQIIPEKPATNPGLKPKTELPQVAFQPDITNTDFLENKEQQPQPVIVLENVVVIEDEKPDLKYPEGLKPDQLKACKAVIKKIKQNELQQDVLNALAYAISLNRVKSAPAYLNGLITAANNGTFTTMQTAEETKYRNPSLLSTQETLTQLRSIKTTRPPINWKLSLFRM